MENWKWSHSIGRKILWIWRPERWNFTPEKLCTSLEDGKPYFDFIAKSSWYDAPKWNSTLTELRNMAGTLPNQLVDQFKYIINEMHPNKYDMHPTAYLSGLNHWIKPIDGQKNDLQIIQNRNLSYALAHFDEVSRQVLWVKMDETSSIWQIESVDDNICLSKKS